MAPTPIVIPISFAELPALRDAAIARAVYRGYKDKETKWQQGMCAPLNKKEAEIAGGPLEGNGVPIFKGLIGETATLRYVNRLLGTNFTVDLEPKKYGDGGVDLIVNGVKIQIKLRKEHPSLVKWKDKNGKIIPFNVSWFVFTEWDFTERVKLLGCLGTKAVRNSEQCETNYGHFNYRIFDDQLLPIQHLIGVVGCRDADPVRVDDLVVDLSE